MVIKAVCNSLIDDIEDMVSADEPAALQRSSVRKNIVPRARKRKELTANEELQADRNEDFKKQLNDITRKSKPIEGFIKRYILNTTSLNIGETLRRESFGEKDESKSHKTILMVGETGVGKSTLINTMVNYMLGFKCDDRIWCEIIETKQNQTNSQTTAVTVYDVFTQKSPVSVTIIDTPGFGSTKGKDEDVRIPESLLELFRSNDGVHEIDAVCLVVTSNTIRLTEMQLYVFDAVLSLFGSDMEKNIVVFITHATRKPSNAINAIKISNIKCAKSDKGEAVYFRFDTFEDFNDEEALDDYNATWDLLNKNMEAFFSFLHESKPVNLKMTLSVLRNRKQLTASINNLKDRIRLTELKQKEFVQTIVALNQFEQEKKYMNNFEFEVDEACKVKVPIESKWWHLSKGATCCSVCEENCHYPGCWWVRDLSWCSVMSNGKCTVCTGKCDYTKHVKEGKMYKLEIRKVKKSMDDLKSKYERETGQQMTLKSKIESELGKLKTKTIMLLEECYQCVMSLDEFALTSEAMSTVQHLDFLIEKMKEIEMKDRAQKLEELKTRSEKQKVAQSVEFV